ncbi:MAG: methyltransferase domain-containing protein, partial [Planctomycetes bacterium]|nr:methyltransferase domain-containing protein [Planctomycetota bacterium]
AIQPFTKKDVSSPLTLLDIASGGGDLAIRLARICRQKGISIEIQGVDISETAIHYATEQAKRHGLNNVTFRQQNVLDEPLPARQWDVVMCSLFLHHLSTDDAIKLLKFMKQAAKQIVLVDDLKRTRLGYWLAWIGCHILTRSPIVHVDGPMSVEGAFTIDEALDITAKAGWTDVQVKRHWPERFLLSCSPNQ